MMAELPTFLEADSSVVVVAVGQQRIRNAGDSLGSSLTSAPDPPITVFETSEYHAASLSPNLEAQTGSSTKSSSGAGGVGGNGSAEGGVSSGKEPPCFPEHPPQKQHHHQAMRHPWSSIEFSTTCLPLASHEHQQPAGRDGNTSPLVSMGSLHGGSGGGGGAPPTGGGAFRNALESQSSSIDQYCCSSGGGGCKGPLGCDDGGGTRVYPPLPSPIRFQLIPGGRSSTSSSPWSLSATTVVVPPPPPPLQHPSSIRPHGHSKDNLPPHLMQSTAATTTTTGHTGES